MNAVGRAGFGAKKINMAIYFIASCFDTIIYILVSAICIFLIKRTGAVNRFL